MTVDQTSAQTPVPGSEDHADGLSAPPESDGAGEQENGSQAPDPNKSLAEANAKYVAQRDEARGERDALAQRVERMQRAEVERLASGSLAMPGDLFSLSGNELIDYLDEDGNVDAEKVAADVAVVLAERPGLQKRLPAIDPSQGLGGSGPSLKREPTAADLFRT